MALQSYPVYPDRIGDILVTGESYPFMDGHSQRRDPSTGYPLWSVRVSLLDIDLGDFAGEISLRLPSADKPTVQPNEFVALSGVARVSSYQVGRGNDARASVSLRGDDFQVVTVSDITAAGDHTRGLFIDWDGLPELRFTRATAASYRPGRSDGAYFIYESARPYQSESNGSGVESHVIEVPGTLQPIKRMSPVAFEGLRALPVLNRETSRARLQLVADSIRTIEPAPEAAWSGNTRGRKTDPSPEPVSADS